MRSKVYLFFILIIGCAPLGTACSFFSAKGNGQTAKDTIVQPVSGEYGKARRIAAIQDSLITESSGLVASLSNKDIFWTHNDSGDDAFLYAFDRSGKRRAIFRVPSAKNYDWEDIAAFTDPKTGENYLFIGDIGDNGRKRSEVVIYRIREPEIKPQDANLTKKNARSTARADAIRVRYPDAARDAETLLVNPANGDLYIVSKSLIGKADVYKLAAGYEINKSNKLEHIGSIGSPSLTPGFLTGGSISPDGKRLVLCDYFAAYEFVLPAKAKSFDEIWKQTGTAIDLGEREQGEAICYGSDRKTIYATSEKKPSPLIEVRRK
ncbi:MAG: hypothetical protein M3209_15125 [Acidobacteriota bacterium]|nr:hypothetical protein [Acidobacteriota bacterium]